MPVTQSIPVANLMLDLKNFRTITQPTEHDAVLAMISVSPGYFWGLMDSLLQDGYLPTENIIVLEEASGEIVVKEGNRRVAALKVIHGLISISSLDFPQSVLNRISALSAQWKAENTSVPCAIYPLTEAATVDKIVTLTHGKGEKAGRDQWNTVARARHNRDMSGGSEPALTILEKYFLHATNHTQQQVDRWSGDYPLTVLDEAIKKIAPRFNVPNSMELAKAYPKIPYQAVLDDIISAVGLKKLRFKNIRAYDDFATNFGMPALSPPNQAKDPSVTSNPATPPSGTSNGASMPGAQPGAPAGAGSSSPYPSPPISAPNSGAQPGSSSPSSSPGMPKVLSAPINDQKSVRRALKSLKITGLNRSKLVTLRIEACHLELKDNPIAFCFLLRSMFEIAGKAFCEDHSASGGPTSKKNGQDKPLVNLLRDITTHLTQNSTDLAMVKMLHGALTQLAKQDGILSVTSMNQLVHSPTFTITDSEICALFGNVFPLLAEMNK